MRMKVNQRKLGAFDLRFVHLEHALGLVLRQLQRHRMRRPFGLNGGMRCRSGDWSSSRDKPHAIKPLTALNLVKYSLVRSTGQARVLAPQSRVGDFLRLP